MKKVFNFFLLLLIAVCCNTSVSAQTTCRSRDSLILRDLYNATTGATWKNTLANNQKWMVPGVPINRWYGITLNANGCVISVDLDNNPTTYPQWSSDGGTNGLKGELPINLGNLSELRYLALTNNPLLTGKVSSILGATKLEQLYLQGNNLDGSIPSQLGNLRNLLFLYLNGNKLGEVNGVPTSGIPQGLGGLHHLIGMDLSNNKLKGTLPTDWTNFPAMTELYLQNNKLLNGPIPPSWVNNTTNFQSLHSLGLYNCSFTGTMPKLNMPALKNFGFFDNQIDSVSNLSSLATIADMVMHNNKLTFDDILYNLPNAPPVPASRVVRYAPQDSIFTQTTYNQNVGDALTIDLGIDKNISDNIYTWTQFDANGNVIGSGYNGTTNPRVYRSKLIFTNIAASHSGIYRCKVTNLRANQLILHSRKAIVNVSRPPSSCCDKAVIQKQEDCCSGIKIDCPVKSVKVTLANGTFTALNGTCFGVATGVTGLSTYTLTPTSACASSNINTCFKATGTSMVGITYSITFADGTTCEKQEKKPCKIITPSCCEKAVINPTKDPCFSQLQITGVCAVKSIKIDLLGGKFTTFSSTCGSPTVAGLTSFVINPTTTCTNAFFAPYFQATGLGNVTITYTVTFTDGTTCVKTETKKCCCKPKVVVPTTGCKGIAVPFAVDEVNCKFTNGRWDFGDGTSSTVANTTHIYAAVGTYNAIFTYTNDCASTRFPVTIVVKDCCCTPKITVPTTGCAGAPVKFSIEGNCKFKEGTWNFGDGTTTNEINTTHTYFSTGGYTVTFYYVDECGEHKIQYGIKILDCPCDINPCITFKTTDLYASFSGGGTSTYPISGYHWDFGDGTWANGYNPTHTYLKEGAYKVCLTVYADNGKGLCGCESERFCIEVVVKKGLTVGAITTCQRKSVPSLITPSMLPSNSTTSSTSLKMSVFPNPTSNNLTVVFDKQVSDTEGTTSQLELYNLQGQLVNQQVIEAGLDEIKVSMQQLPVGIYMIALRQNGQIISTTKVTKN